MHDIDFFRLLDESALHPMNSLRIASVILGLSVAGVLIGCDAMDSSYARATLPGMVQIGGDTARVDIAGFHVGGTRGWAIEPHQGPVPVQAGVPFEITVWTFGSWTFDPKPSRVSVEGATASIAVFDEQATQGPQHADLAYLPRTDVIVFATEGEAEVVIQGVKPNMNTGQFDPHELRFPILVEAAP